MRNVPESLMVFAAGLGTRMGSLTASRPKPLIEVAGKPLIDHALLAAKQAGIDTVVVNVHYLADVLVNHLADCQVAISDETDRLLDTGGGLRRALPLLGPGPVFTMNSDAVFSGQNPLEELRARWRPGDMDALLLLVPRNAAASHRGRGDFDMDAQGRLTRGSAYVYTGVQIVNPAGLDDIPEDVFSLNLLWDRILSRGRLFGCLHDGRWCDVGHSAGIRTAEDMLRGDADV